MNIDVANMVVNIGEQMQKVNWLESGVTFASVFLGAFLAHRFSLKLEMRKAHRQIRGDFSSLVNQIHLDFSEMLNYKKMYLDKIKLAYENRDINSFHTMKNIPCMTFAIDVDRYVFLNDCNKCFLSELKIIKSLNEQMNTVWLGYTQAVSKLTPLLRNGDENTLLSLKITFWNFYEVYNYLCARIYYLNRHLIDCYERFFNINYYDDFETDEKFGKETIQYISPTHQEELLEISEYFNKYWAPDHTFVEELKFNYRKLKYCLKCIKIYFFGRGKPKKEGKIKGKK